MIADRFGPRTFANMEVDLERACKVLGVGSEGHQARRHIAGKIVECAEGGDNTLGGLTQAGRVAAIELCVRRAGSDAGHDAAHKWAGQKEPAPARAAH
ncbi:MAG: hypothetical protein QOF72_3166 [Blastocatellia bacterium]|jgi:hypothetical protein|nr:hypothetical protein [Blastocatellia bacterium]